MIILDIVAVIVFIQILHVFVPRGVSYAVYNAGGNKVVDKSAEIGGLQGKLRALISGLIPIRKSVLGKKFNCFITSDFSNTEGRIGVCRDLRDFFRHGKRNTVVDLIGIFGIFKGKIDLII